MLKKTITFLDLDGNTISEDFHFNLSKAEITEMELSKEGGLGEYMKKIVESNNGAQLIAIFKDLLLKSVGRRSEDGRRFIKNQEIIDDFMQTDAYSELFMELATDANAAVEFITGIVPANLEADLKKANVTPAQVETVSADLLNKTEPKPAKDYDALLADPNWQPGKDDLLAMSQAQLQRAFARKNQSA